MYDPKTGVWTANANEEFAEHFETTYYLKYNIEKALYSLDKILMKKIDYSEFSNRCAYYHFYVDNLFNAIGHIRRRFYNKNVRQERIERNRLEYNYYTTNKDGSITCNYPIICQREIRHFIEHIDERDELLLENGFYNGTFNVIYKGMNSKTKNDLLNQKRAQNNLLNLISNEYKILKIDKCAKEPVEVIVNLDELRAELENLKEYNDTIWNYLSNKFWK